jgi:hypothetical protein
MADSIKYNGSTWEHSLRKLTTSTDTFTTLPTDIYADGNNATVGISGNTVQSGTPSPQNPIMPQGCGDLETVGTKAGQYKIPISSANATTPVYLGEVETTRKIKKLVLTGEEAWQLWNGNYYSPVIDRKGVIGTILCTHFINSSSQGISYNNQSTSGLKIASVAVPFVSDLSGLKEWLAAQYANGTPVTIWYVLATPETAAINEPLMKIGDYADEVSGITIPTITGKDVFDVETTLKPSEVELTYTGWHDATVKEWDGSQWNE